MFFGVTLHQASEKYARTRWESNLRPLEWTHVLPIELRTRGRVGSSMRYFETGSFDINAMIAILSAQLIMIFTHLSAMHAGE